MSYYKQNNNSKEKEDTQKIQETIFDARRTLAIKIVYSINTHIIIIIDKCIFTRIFQSCWVGPRLHVYNS